MDVARAALALVELRHEGDGHRLLGGDLLGAELVDAVVVAHADRRAVAEVDLVLSQVALALRALDVHPGALHRVADPLDERLDVGGVEQRVVDAVGRRLRQVAISRLPRLPVGGTKDHELELRAHLRGQPARVEALELAAQDLPRRHLDRLPAFAIGVRQDERRTGVPRNQAQRRQVGLQLEIAEPAIPTRQAVPLLRRHVDVGRQEVFARLGSVRHGRFEEVPRGQPLADEAPFHIDQRQHDGVDRAVGHAPLERFERQRRGGRSIRRRGGSDRVQVGHRRLTSRTSLPRTPPRSSLSWAAAARSRANTSSTLTFRRPFSIRRPISARALPSGSTSASTTWTPRCAAATFSQSGAPSATASSRPPARSVSSRPRVSSPPTRSSATSTSRLDSAARSCRPVVTTHAAKNLAIWTAKSPTPPDAPWISTVVSSSTSATSTRHCHAVSAASGTAAASTGLRPRGMRASWREGAVTYSE